MRNTLIFSALRALLQNADSINRPYWIVLLVFTGGVAMAAAPYPRAQASGGRMEGVCLYRAKTFIYTMSYVYIKKAGTLIVPAPIVF